MNYIKIKDKEWPFKLTIGAVRSIKEKYNIDAIEAMSGNDLGSFGVILFESIKSACRSEKIDCEMDISDVEDNISVSELGAIVQQFVGSIVSSEEPKKDGGKRIALGH